MVAKNELYGELQAIGQECTANGREIDHASIVDFWQTAEDKTQDGTLIPGWVGKGDSPIDHVSRAEAVGRSYKDLLATHPPTEYRFEQLVHSI